MAVFPSRRRRRRSRHDRRRRRRSRGRRRRVAVRRVLPRADALGAEPIARGDGGHAEARVVSALRAPVAEDEILLAVDASAHHARGLVRRRRRRVRREVHPSLVQVCVEFGEDDVRVGLGHVPRDDEPRADGFVRVGLPRLAAPLVANLMVGLGGLGAAEVVEHDAGEGILVRLDRAPTRVRVARVGLPGGRGRGRGDRRRGVGVPRRAVGGDGGDGARGGRSRGSLGRGGRGVFVLGRRRFRDIVLGRDGVLDRGGEVGLGRVREGCRLELDRGSREFKRIGEGRRARVREDRGWGRDRLVHPRGLRRGRLRVGERDGTPEGVVLVQLALHRFEPPEDRRRAVGRRL